MKYGHGSRRPPAVRAKFSSKMRGSSGSHDGVWRVKSGPADFSLYTTFQVGSTMTHNAPVAIYLATIEREYCARLTYKHTHIDAEHSLCCWYICLKSLELSLSPLSFFKATQQLLLFLPFLFLITKTLTALPTQIQTCWGFCSSSIHRYISLYFSQELAITHIKWPTLKIEKICALPAPKLLFVPCAE